MKKINLLFIITLCFFTSSLFAQKKAAPNKPSLPSIKSCNADIDSSKSNKMSIATFQEWSNSSKLTVKCSDGKSYLLHQFGIQVFVKNPMEMKDLESVMMVFQ